MSDTIINQIKKYRQKKEITQDALAKEVGVSRQSIISIEQGRYIPSLPLALRFARYFNQPVEVLFQLREAHHG